MEMTEFKLDEVAFNIKNKKFVIILDGVLPDSYFYVVGNEEDNARFPYLLTEDDLIKLQPDTPQNRLQIKLKYGS